MSANTALPLSTPLSQALVAYTIELDNEFERRFALAGGRARVVSLVMWSNFLRFVGDGITVGELPAAAGLQRSRMLSTLGGVERWRYVAVGTEHAGQSGTTKRNGFGSARGLQSTWVVRLTPDGRKAEAIWRTLFDEIEARWKERFGAAEIDELNASLRAIVGGIDVALPKVATSMALTFLVRSGFLVVEGATVRTKLARLTPEGRACHEAYARLHAEVEKGLSARFGVAAVGRLRSSLEQLLEQREGTRALLSQGLEPHPGGWRAGKAYIAQTQAVVDDPTAGLPHYPMVLHRGGWPDGS